MSYRLSGGDISVISTLQRHKHQSQHGNARGDTTDLSEGFHHKPDWRGEVRSLHIGSLPAPFLPVAAFRADRLPGFVRIIKPAKRRGEKRTYRRMTFGFDGRASLRGNSAERDIPQVVRVQCTCSKDSLRNGTKFHNSRIN
jgi:hypothetical protein